jgi:cell division protein FtsB
MAVFRPHLFLGIAGAIALLILFSLAQEANRRWQVQKEVARLEGDVAAMEKQLVALEQLNEYFRTSDYKERLAREQLNFRAPGEQVVLIPEQESSKGANTSIPAAKPDTRSIPLKWWYTLFVDE